MSLELVDYNSLVLDLLTSDPPAMAFDVTYRVLDSEGQLAGEVPAHKFLLALASPVLRTGFYGEQFQEENKIDMKETTLKAFKAMISIIYKRQVNFKVMPAAEMFELVNLAERYELPKLKAKLKQELEAMSLSKETIMEVAKTAMKFHLLEEASKATLDNCAMTLNRELVSRESVVKFSARYYGTGDENIAMKLMAMMNNFPHSSCSNCQESPCQSGMVITSVKQVRAGTVMAPNSDCTSWSAIWNMEQRGEAVVESIREDSQKLMLGRGIGSVKYNMSSGYPVIFNGIPMFRFYCRK